MTRAWACWAARMGIHDQLGNIAYRPFPCRNHRPQCGEPAQFGRNLRLSPASGRLLPGQRLGRTRASVGALAAEVRGDIRTPPLIIHSEGDLRCPIEQAEQLFAALKVQGKEAVLVRYPQESSHGMSRSGPPDLRVHRLEQILQWWAKHLMANTEE